MPELRDLQIQIHVNGQHTFFLNEKIISAYSGRLKNIIKQQKRTVASQIKEKSVIRIEDFPGGPNGFEQASRFCYNKGRIEILVSNVSLLHCSASFLGMTEKIYPRNLLPQTETFLEGMPYWSWSDILVCLESCETFFASADSSGLVQKLIRALTGKIALASCQISSSSSPSSSSSESVNPSSSSCEAWWFDDLTIFSPKIIERFVRTVGVYKSGNNSVILTKFLLHYLKRSAVYGSRSDYGGLADTAVYGVVLVGKCAFSCRRLFWVLRVLGKFGLSRNCRVGLEKMIGGMLDEATLDDLLVSSGNDDGGDGGVYDVDLVLRLIELFVVEDQGRDYGVSLEKMKKAGKLIDMYLREISPDPNLKMSKFLAVAVSLPDHARDSFDGVYRALDIYLESHPSLSFEERSRLCKCLNYNKLSLETCKDLARNPRIPPRAAIDALSSYNKQHGHGDEVRPSAKDGDDRFVEAEITSPSNSAKKLFLDMDEFVVQNNSCRSDDQDSFFSEESEGTRLHLERMQRRVVELENLCRKMKAQMSKLRANNSNNPVRNSSPAPARKAVPRLC